MLDLLDLITDADFGVGPSAWLPPVARNSGAGSIEAGLEIDKRHALARQELDRFDDLVAARLIGTYVGRRVRQLDSDLNADASGEKGDRYRRSLKVSARSCEAALYTLYSPRGNGSVGFDASRGTAISFDELARFVEAEERLSRIAVSRGRSPSH